MKKVDTNSCLRIPLKLKTWKAIGVVLCGLLLIVPTLAAQDAHFHNAPSSSSQEKNPYAGQHAGDRSRSETLQHELRLLPWEQRNRKWQCSRR